MVIFFYSKCLFKNEGAHFLNNDKNQCSNIASKYIKQYILSSLHQVLCTLQNPVSYILMRLVAAT